MRFGKRGVTSRLPRADTTEAAASTSSNNDWGRWGQDDERGALNLVDTAAALRGVGSVRSGTTISLGAQIGGAAPSFESRSPPHHFMVRDGGDYAAGLQESPGFGFADDYLLVACHGTTHIDALAHIWKDGLMWNGIPATEVTSRGAHRAGIEKAGPIVTRALFVDLVPDASTGLDPGETVPVERLASAVDQLGIRPESGDALLIRTGWLARWRQGTADAAEWPGIGEDCADWIHDRGFALVGSDNIAVEASPGSDATCGAPLHVRLMRDYGIHLMELLDLEPLSRSRAAAFLLIVAPLAIVGGAGSPVAPVAVL